MLSIEVFNSQFSDFLCEHWRESNLAQPVKDAYYMAFQHFSDETFTELCQKAFIECDRRPAPKWFLEKSSELAERARVQDPSIKALPDSNLLYFDPEQLRSNQLKIKRMCKEIGLMAKRTQQDEAIDF